MGVFCQIFDKLKHKEYESEAHIDGLNNLAEKVIKEFNLNQLQADNLLQLCDFHDIGMVAIEDTVTKPELNEEDWEEIKTHPEKGYVMAKSSEDTVGISNLIYTHHEKWDGTGYPQNLKGEEIPYIARLFSIMDAYDVMTRGRPYKGKMSSDEAIEELQSNAAKQFDPEIVEKFNRLIKEA